MSPRRVTPAQYNAMVRRAQAKQRQAVNEYNRKVNEHNRKVKRAVDGYNREVRAHNNRVRANRQRPQRELRRLESQPTTVHVTYRTSVQSLTRSFERVDTLVEEQGATQSGADLAELGEGETANSVGVLNALLDTSPDVDDDPSLRVPSLAEELGTFSDDLVKRWQGALFALNPANPDAARHGTAPGLVDTWG